MRVTDGDVILRTHFILVWDLRRFTRSYECAGPIVTKLSTKNEMSMRALVLTATGDGEGECGSDS